MRIVGGKYKGRTLLEFGGNDIRPTSDKVRESLFNIIQFRIAGSNFLDLFSGTGAMGIEALSRGAKMVTFNDIAKSSIDLLKKNLVKLKVENNYTIKNLNAETFLSTINNKYDIVFIDPPYKSDLGIAVLNQVDKVLSDDGIAIYENEKPFDVTLLNPNLKIYDQRKYGRVHLTFFRKV